MPLQQAFSDTPANITRKSNIVNMPASESLKIVEDLRHALKTNPETASRLALRFLTRIAASDTAASGSARGGLAPWQKRKVDRYLRENLERSIGLNKLAGEVRLSVSHFCRAFKKSFGDTPHAYVLRLRLELAQKLMLTTDDPLSHIALRCGLADQAHLSKLFRHTFHDTPNAWRRRNLTEAQAAARKQRLRAAA
jgi:transcriptional regulator GlxA family with amidase domain